MATRATTLLVRLSGANPRILRLVPEETPKFAALGSVILATASIAGISMLFALTMARISLWVAIPVAVAWSLMTANLDRLMIIGLQRSAGWLRTMTLIVPRLMLAILLGTTTSTPLVLRIFQPEIEAELASRGEHRGSGLLARLDALNTIATRDASVNVAQYALLLLFVCLSVLPVLVRILGLFGPPSGYDRLAAEDEARARAEALRNVAKTRAEMMGLEREVADQLAELLNTLGPPVKSRTGNPDDEPNGDR
jgi:uncharacterized protein DUF4407